MTEVMKNCNDIKEEKIDDLEHNRKDTEKYKFSYTWLQIEKTEDMKNVLGVDSISIDASCNSEDSKQANDKLDDIVSKINCIDQPRECVEVHSEVTCNNAIVKVEMDISEDVKTDIEEQKLDYACLDIIKTEDIKNMFTCDNSSGKAHWDSEDNKQVNVKLLDYDDNHRKCDATEGIFKIENSKEEANLDNPLDFDVTLDIEKYAHDRITNSEILKLTDVTYKGNSKFSNSAQWYRCKFCQYRSKCENKFKKHFENKHKKGPRWYRCHHCAFITVKKQYLKGHLKRKHDANAEWYKCRLCNLETKHKYYLKRHYKTKHDERSDWLQCEYCAFKTECEKSLKNHLKFKHDIGGEELHQCQFCDYSCNFKSVLRHLKNKHSQIQHYCQNCEFRTNTKASLLQHYATLHNQDSVNTVNQG